MIADMESEVPPPEASPRQLRARRALTTALDRLFEGIPTWLLLVLGTLAWTIVLLLMTWCATSNPTP